MRMRLLSLVAAALAVALATGPAGAQQYRGYSRPGNYTPGNYGMTRPTGYSASNYGIMRPGGYMPSNFGNPGASIFSGSNEYAGAGPGTPVPIGALSTLPGTPVGPALFPSSVSSFPAGTPQPTAANQATFPGGVPQTTAGSQAPFPGGIPQPTAGDQATFPGGVPAPTANGTAAPTVGMNAVPAPTSAMGTPLTSPYTTPGATAALNPAAAPVSPYAVRQTSYLGYSTAVPAYGAYTAGPYPSSFSSALGRVYGSSGH